MNVNDMKNKNDGCNLNSDYENCTPISWKLNLQFY